MSCEKTPSDDQIRPIPPTTATPEVSPACTATNRKTSGVLSEAGGKTLSMREFFEAGGRAYEVYLSCKDHQPLLESPVLASCAMPSSATKGKRIQMNVDQLPLQMPDIAAKNSGNGGASTSPPVLTVVRLPIPSGSTTPSAPVYTTQTTTGHKLQRPFPVTSQDPKGIGARGSFVAADVIDRVIASRLGLPTGTRSSFGVDPFVYKDDARCIAVPERQANSVGPSLFTLTETLFSNSPITTSSPCPVSFISTTPTALPSTTPHTSPLEKAEERPPNVDHLMNDCLKRKRTADEDSEVAIDLTSKRIKSADGDLCESVNQSIIWRKEALPIDRPQNSPFEADGKCLSRPSIAGVLPEVVYQSATIFSDVTLWSVDQVVRFVANVQGCREYAEIFRQEQIDGACLIRLSEGHLLNVIRMKLGPALRLRQAISSLCNLDAI